MENPEKKLHYWMISGNVVCEYEDHIQAILQNALVTTDTQEFGVRQLSKAQTSLQVNLFKKIGEVPKVVDVVILSVSHLGYMTEAAFHAPPEGMIQQEIDPTTAQITDFPGMV